MHRYMFSRYVLVNTKLANYKILKLRKMAMDIGVYSIKSISDEKIDNLIGTQESFVLENVDRLNMGEAIATLENKMKTHNLSCRVYTKGRSVSLLGIFIPLINLGALASAVGIVAHNLATYNPDYEIAKNLLTKTLTVTYKKNKNLAIVP